MTTTAFSIMAYLSKPGDRPRETLVKLGFVRFDNGLSYP